MSLRENLKEDATHIWGIFHDLKEPDKKNPPRHRLCKIREATHKSNGKKRNAGEYDSYLDALFAKKLQELTRALVEFNSCNLCNLCRFFHGPVA